MIDDLSLLLPAVEAGREALRDLDDDEVPAALRRVRAYSGPRLPPPLARKLLAELDALPWLREKARDELAGVRRGDDRAREASRLFLERAADWWTGLASVLAGSAATEAEAERGQLAARVAKLEEELDHQRRRGREERDRLRDEAEEARRGLRRAREEQRRDDAADPEALRAARAAAAEAERVLEGVRRELDELDRAHGRLREWFRAVKAHRAELARGMQARSGAEGVVADGLGLARKLDATATAAASLGASPAAAAAPAPVPPPLQLPPGVSPDTAAAVDWLAGRVDRVLVLVDGYNLAHHLLPGGAGPSRARAAVEAMLRRLARTGPALRVQVVYDSSLAGERARASSSRGVEVVFAVDDELADDELVARAGAAAGAVVVVSSDRDVRERAAAAGALALWAEALAGWARRRA